MPLTSPKSFDFHNFVRHVLRQSDSRTYFLAENTDLSLAMRHVPYRNYFYGIGLATAGCRRIQVGFDTYEFRAGTLLTIGPSILRQWLDLSLPFESDTIFFSSDLFQAPIHPHFLSEMSIFKTGIQHVLPLSTGDIHAVSQLFRTLRQYKNQTKIVAAQTLTLIEMIAHFYDDYSHQTTAILSRQESLLRDFDMLLQKHYLENKDVAFYAQKLNLTANHLSESIKMVTGKSAKKRIEEALIFEAKSLLRQTNMSIKEITYWLGFEDDSYFVRFFKQAEGITPNAYRLLNP